MELFPFLEQIRTHTFVPSAPVIFLRGKNEYPLLLCSLLLDRLRTVTECALESLDLQEHDDVASRCSTTFLGMRSLYWVHNITLLDDPKQKRIVTFLQQYMGPNCLLFFALQRPAINVPAPWLVVDVPDDITREQFLALAVFLDGSVTESMKHFAQQVFAQVQRISLDAACILMYYAQVLGSHQSVFMKRWFSQLVAPERSLFTLSQYFFAKNGRAFFEQWSVQAHEYPDLFWISFWSEQLWRAALYINLMRDNNRAQAEKMAFRLPFTFKNKEWRRWDPAELIAAHSFLLSIDEACKNGGSFFNIELLYAKLFAGDFAIK